MLGFGASYIREFTVTLVFGSIMGAVMKWYERMQLTMLVVCLRMNPIYTPLLIQHTWEWAIVRICIWLFSKKKTQLLLHGRTSDTSYLITRLFFLVRLVCGLMWPVIFTMLTALWIGFGDNADLLWWNNVNNYFCQLTTRVWYQRGSEDPTNVLEITHIGV